MFNILRNQNVRNIWRKSKVANYSTEIKLVDEIRVNDNKSFLCDQLSEYHIHVCDSMTSRFVYTSHRTIKTKGRGNNQPTWGLFQEILCRITRYTGISENTEFVYRRDFAISTIVAVQCERFGGAKLASERMWFPSNHRQPFGHTHVHHVAFGAIQQKFQLSAIPH